MTILGIDVGGTGIKGALVDVESGNLISDRFRLATPPSRVPEDVLPTIKQIVDHFDYKGAIGVGFPAVVVDGRLRTPFTAHEVGGGWVGYPVADELSKMTGCPITLINDADAAGIAEKSFGVARDKSGTTILLTLGTGIGSAVFHNDHLIPNTELGKIYLQDRPQVIEQYISSSARERRGLDWKSWAAELDEYLTYLEWLFTPNCFIIGGGISKLYKKYVPHLKIETPVIPASLRNKAGIIGAAMATISN